MIDACWGFTPVLEPGSMPRGRMEARRGRYRIRTWLRGHTPYPVSRRIPKGPKDCGNHVWYRRDDEWADCYHCAVGHRRLERGEDVREGGETTARPSVAVAALSRKRNSASARESASKLGENRQVRVQPHPIKPTDTQR